MLDRTNTWRRQEGLCLICGQPVAAPLYRQGITGRVAVVAKPDAGKKKPAVAGGGEEDGDVGAYVAAIDSDGRLLTQECPVRLSMLGFNALGEFHAAHIIDDYTLLEISRRKTSFRNEFAKSEGLLSKANGPAIELFKQKILADTPEAQRRYAAAAALGKRVIGDLTVCACKRCNTAMNRIYAHSTAVYRCFGVTHDSNVVELEDARAVVSNNAKKVLQQIALYFKPTLNAKHEVTDWHVKTEDELLVDGALWRCVAHLYDWGVSPVGGGVRARLIAIFHAAHYIYLTNSSLYRSDIDFTSWYTHIWRAFYMEQYRRAPATFFGMRQTEVARTFDFTYKDGARWASELRTRFSVKGDELEAQVAARSDALRRNLSDYEDALAAAAVVDERGLLRFYARHRKHASAKVAAHHWLSFFRYNLDGSFGAAFLLAQVAALEGQIARALAKTATSSSGGSEEEELNGLARAAGAMYLLD